MFDPRRLLPALLAALAIPGAAHAQQTTLQSDDGSMENLWRLTSPNAGPADWIGVAYTPPFEHPFRVVSASMFFIDQFCCTLGSCSASCGDFVDWDRMIIARENTVVDSAGLTPNIASPVAEQVSVRFPGAGGDRTSPPWTLTPHVWTLPAGTIFDAPGRVFFAVKYLSGDQYMNFAVDSSSPNRNTSVYTSDGFATRSSIWAFGNVGMRVVVAPLFSLKVPQGAPVASFQLNNASSVTMLSFRIAAGESATTVTRVRVTPSGTGNDLTGVASVRLVLDADGDGRQGAGETVLASGRFTADNAALDLTLSRTLAAGAAERWLVVYDLAGAAPGGTTFTARINAAADVSSSAGAPYLSGSITGGTVTIAGRLVASRGPMSMPTRIVPAGAQALPTLQVRLQAENEAVSISRIAITADGTLNDATGISQVRLYRDVDGSGTVNAGDIPLANGSFPRDDGRLDIGFTPFTIAANATADLLVVYDLTAVAAGGNTLRTIVALPGDIAGSGAASGPLPETGPRVTTGLPVIGNVATVGGAIAVALGAASPGASTAQPGTSDVPMLQLSLAAGAEPIGVSAITFDAVGSGDELTEVGRARLWRDLNGNGAVDATDTPLGTPATYAADNGSITFAFPAEIVPQGATRLWLLTYDFTTRPTGGETFRARVAGAASIRADGQASGAPITASGMFPLNGGLRTMLGGFSASLGPANPPETRVQPGRADVPVLQLQLAAQGEMFSVSRVRLSAAGSLDDLAGVTAVTILRDVGTPGVRDAADTVLGTSTFAADDGVAVFNFSPAVAFTSGSTQRWLVVYQLSQSPRPGQTFRASIALPADVTVTGSLSGATTPQGLPLASATHGIGGTLLVAPGPLNPAGGVVSPGARDLTMIQVRLTASGEPITVTGLTFTASGSGDEMTGVTSARLFVDADRDGALDTPGDVALGTAPFSANDGTLSFTFPGRTIAAGATEDWIVVYALGNAPVAGDSFQLALAGNTDVAAAAPSGALPRAEGAPVMGGARTVLGSLVLSRGANDPAAATVARGATGVPILQIQASGAQEAFRVTRLRFFASGNLDDANDVLGVTLIRDADGSGTRTMGDAVLAGPARFSGDDGAVELAGFTSTIPLNGTERWLVIVDLAASAPAGGTFGLRLQDGSDVTATGLDMRAIAAPSGLPLSSNRLSVGGTLRVGMGPTPPSGRVILRGAAGVEALQLAFTADTEPVTVTRVTLRAGGSGDDAAGLARAALYADRNGNGRVDPGDALLGEGRFAMDDGSLAIPLSEVVQVGAPLHVLARLDFTTAPRGGDTFRLSLDPTADVAFTSMSGAVSVLGGTVSGAVLTAGGGFAIALGPQSSPGTPVNQVESGVPVMQLEMRAVNESCTVAALTITAAGSIDDGRDVMEVRLVRDANDNGLVDFGDTPIGMPARFARDDGSITFTGLARTIGLDAAERWLVVYDLSGTASDRETLRARIDDPSDVVVSCNVSGPVVASGTPVEGGVFTIEEDGLLLVRRGALTPASAFFARGAVRSPALQLRLQAHVHPLSIDRVVLTASTSAGAPGLALASVELFRDANGDGRLDRSDQLLGAGSAFDAMGRTTVMTPGLTVAVDEPVYLLAVASVSDTATPGTRFALGLAADADVPARGPAGAVMTQGAPIAGERMTVAGNLNVARVSTATASVVRNDDASRVALGISVSAVSERFTVTSMTLTAEGTMDPAVAVTSLSLVSDDDGDGAPGAMERRIASGVSFAQGAKRVSFRGLGEVIAAGQTARWLVVLDLAGRARVDQTLTLSLAANVDVTAVGDRVGATSPVGAPLVGDTFVIGRSLLIREGPHAPVAQVVAANARDVPALQLELGAYNEDVTVSRLSVHPTGSLDDGEGIERLRLFVDADENGRIDPGDTEVAEPVRPGADGAAVSFSPLAERVPRGARRVYLVVVELSGSGTAGSELAIDLASDADVTAFGAISGAIGVEGAPVNGAKIALVGALNVRLGPASPPGTGVTAGTAYPALQLELFTQGETVTVDQLALTLEGSADDAQAVKQIKLWRDMDGDGAASGDDQPIAAEPVTGNDGTVTFTSLDLVLPPETTARVLAEVVLTGDATPGGTIRMTLSANENVRARGMTSGAIRTVGAPIQGSAFTIVRPLPPTSPPPADEGCSCNATPERGPASPTTIALGLLLSAFAFVTRRRR